MDKEGKGVKGCLSPTRCRRWSGSGISCTIRKSSAPCSRQITMAEPHHSIFYRLDALPDVQPTAQKHWKQKNI